MGKKNRKQSSIFVMEFNCVIGTILTFIVLSIFSINLFSEEKIPGVNPSEHIIYDNFNGVELAPEYEIWDGPGFYYLQNGKLRYCPRKFSNAIEMPGENSFILLDYL